MINFVSASDNPPPDLTDYKTPMIFQMPFEIQTMIFSHLDLAGLNLAERICTRCKEITHENWKAVGRILQEPIATSDEMKVFIQKLHYRAGRIVDLPEYLILKEPFTLNNRLKLKRWLDARDTLIVWKELAKAIGLSEEGLDPSLLSFDKVIEKGAEFPRWVLENREALALIKILRLSVKQLYKLPPEIKFLTHLEELYLEYNQLESLPEEMVYLSHLRILNVRMNGLMWIPPLKQLNALVIDFNSLQSLPAGMENLEELSATYNQLIEIPTDMVSLKKLKLDFNQIKKIPKLSSNLNEISIGFNPFSEIDESLAHLQTKIWLGIININDPIYPQFESLCKIREKNELNPFNYLIDENKIDE